MEIRKNCTTPTLFIKRVLPIKKLAKVVPFDISGSDGVGSPLNISTKDGKVRLRLGNIKQKIWSFIQAEFKAYLIKCKISWFNDCITCGII